jgi:hypothetical protein
MNGLFPEMSELLPEMNDLLSGMNDLLSGITACCRNVFFLLSLPFSSQIFNQSINHHLSVVPKNVARVRRALHPCKVKELGDLAR